jgi:hypothetical protein
MAIWRGWKKRERVVKRVYSSKCRVVEEGEADSAVDG